MATIKVKFRASSVPAKPGTIYYLITHRKQQRSFSTDFRIYPSEWDDKSSSVIAAPGSAPREQVLKIQRYIRLDMDKLARIVKNFEEEGQDYMAQDIIAEFTVFKSRCSLFFYMAEIIDDLKKLQRLRTSETYVAALRSFRTFMNGEDIRLDCISGREMQAYQSWLLGRGITRNTVSFYARILRAVYNRAVEEELIEDRHPFRHIYTGVDKTVKRALSADFIRRINSLDLSWNKTLEYARDMFILSFMFRGMSFIDMAFLQKTALSNGYLTYRRHKTGQTLMIKWTAQMQAILDKYPDKGSGYLLPVISVNCRNERNAYKNVAYNINRGLKQIAGMINLPMPLTLYVARHSWASIARAQGIPLSVISEGMGHDSELTTQIYLAGLDTSAIDRANSKIIGSVMG